MDSIFAEDVSKTDGSAMARLMRNGRDFLLALDPPSCSGETSNTN